MRAKPEEIVSVLREEIQNYDTRVRRDETGTVLEVGDGIATVYGLDQAVYGELVELDTGVKGMVMNLARDLLSLIHIFYIAKKIVKFHKGDLWASNWADGVRFQLLLRREDRMAGRC